MKDAVRIHQKLGAKRQRTMKKCGSSERKRARSDEDEKEHEREERIRRDCR